MGWAIYFSLISTMTAETAPELHELVIKGNLREAAARACMLAETAPGSSRVAALSACGDLQLVIGAFEEAEESLRKAQSLVKDSTRELRFHACRNGAWQALARGRINLALKCFAGILAEPTVSNWRRLEALAGQCMGLHLLGCVDDTARLLDEMATLAAGVQPTIWTQLVKALRADLAMQWELRRAPPLNDHVFWSAAALSSRHCPTEQAIDMTDLPPILFQRLQFMCRVQSLAQGESHAISDLRRYIDWTSTAMPGHARSFKVEAALAALAAGQTSFADTLLDMRRASLAPGVGCAPLRGDFEYQYCLAKLQKQLGRAEESMRQFEQYALRAMQWVRAEVVPSAPHVGSGVSETNQALDDVGMLLPPRYRRAYSYMLENLGNPNLSVREIAAHIGVTQRSLQIAFKTHVGISPKDVLQRKRLDRISSELSADQRTNLTILEVARKWGVPNRSKLANWYRRQRRGKPSDSLAA